MLPLHDEEPPSSSSSSTPNGSCGAANNGNGYVRSESEDGHEYGRALDACIWGDLPEHLLERMMSYLPIVALLRCRSLSQKWQSFIASPLFLRMTMTRNPNYGVMQTSGMTPRRYNPSNCVMDMDKNPNDSVTETRNPKFSSVTDTARTAKTDTASTASTALYYPVRAPPAPPWFLMFANHDYQDGCTYDPSTNRWYQIPLPSFSVAHECHIPIASAGGLVCFTSSIEGQKAFIVCNPLTRAWRKLPPLPKPPSFLETVGMVMMASTSNEDIRYQSSYKVIVAGTHDILEDAISTQVFDSGTNAWEETSAMPRGADPMLSAVECSGEMYSWCCGQDGLLHYSIQKGVWAHMETAMASSSVVSNALIGWEGGLFMLGGVHENETTKGISVWELNSVGKTSTRRWVEVDTMPPGLLQEFLAGGRTFFMCVGCHGMVLLHVGGCTPTPPTPMLVYDLTTKSWHKLHICSLVQEHLGTSLIDGIAFTPQLDATP